MNMLKKIGVPAAVTNRADVVQQASKLILPGIGAFDAGMQRLHQLGLVEMLNQKALIEKTPVLGICLGMQLMTKSSEEGSAAGLGWIDARTVHFGADQPAASERLRLPHIGWNFVDRSRTHDLLHDLPDDPRFYFVHTYRVVCADPRDAVLTTEYAGIPFTSAFARDNIFGIQCHPEKSHKFGMKVFTNFARWSPNAEGQDQRRYA
jgi:glutamine amidotransferase